MTKQSMMMFAQRALVDYVVDPMRPTLYITYTDNGIAIEAAATYGFSNNDKFKYGGLTDVLDDIADKLYRCDIHLTNIDVATQGTCVKAVKLYFGSR